LNKIDKGAILSPKEFLMFLEKVKGISFPDWRNHWKRAKIQRKPWKN
jgi:hypothetical protein